MATVISKEEFLKACNQKLALDQQKQEDERRRQEEERKRREEEERRRQEEEARKRADAERKRRENAEWDAWYKSLPASCKRTFTYGGFQYSVDAQNRRTTKTPLLGDPRDFRDLREIEREKRDIRTLNPLERRFSGFVNEELGI
jgi:membrane-bound lytic murein transglycosylase